MPGNDNYRRMQGVPPWLRLGVTAFVAVLVPVYWSEYGFLHFLWISDIALFATVAVLWRGSRLLNSMVVLGALPFELFWNVGFSRDTGANSRLRSTQ